MMFATILLYLEQPYLDGVFWAETVLCGYGSPCIVAIFGRSVMPVLRGYGSRQQPYLDVV